MYGAIQKHQFDNGITATKKRSRRVAAFRRKVSD